MHQRNMDLEDAFVVWTGTWIQPPPNKMSAKNESNAQCHTTKKNWQWNTYIHIFTEWMRRHSIASTLSNCACMLLWLPCSLGGCDCCILDVITNKWASWAVHLHVVQVTCICDFAASILVSTSRLLACCAASHRGEGLPSNTVALSAPAIVRLDVKYAIDMRGGVVQRKKFLTWNKPAKHQFWTRT